MGSIDKCNESTNGSYFHSYLSNDILLLCNGKTRIEIKKALEDVSKFISTNLVISYPPIKQVLQIQE